MHNRTFEAGWHDGVVEANMMFCVESFVGDPYGGERVILEAQILVTATGPVKLSSYVYEEQLL